MDRTSALGIALVVGGVAIAGFVALDRTGDDVGTVTVGAMVEAEAEGPGDAMSPSPSATPSTSYPSPPAIGRRSALLEDYVVEQPVAPVSLSIGSIDVTATVVPVGVDPDGLMGVPDDVSTVGWYRFGGGMDADEGTVVVAGHVDDRFQGRGAFFDLRALEPGDEVSVTDEDGAVTEWRVTGRRTFQKESLPVEDLYRRSGEKRLVLITCGGDFDSSARNYESNVVVEAEPVT